jgi:hypothetical protein
MAEAFRDKILQGRHVRRAADAHGRTSDGLTAIDSRSYEQKTTTASAFMFHYPDFGLSLKADRGSRCCNLLHSVHKLFADCCTIEKTHESMSRYFLAISLVVEGAMQAKSWTLLHSGSEENQDQT